MSWIEILFGKPLASSEEGEQRVGVLAGIPMLGLDALASAAYGPEAALTLLIPLGTLGLAYIGPISLLIIFLLLIVYFSYRQTISAYPGGGGRRSPASSYTVARENLGVMPALMAAAAGGRPSSSFTVILLGLARTLLAAGRPVPVVSPPPLPAASAHVHLWLLISDENPDRQIAVIIPELVENRWYQYLLHNQRATMLKAALLFRGHQRVVVINVPWYLQDELSEAARDG